jgi:glycosyltransferase involved in cell wall biosynthesis
VKEIARRSDLIYINGLLIQAASVLRRKRVPRLAKIVGDTVWEHARNAGLSHQGFEEFQTSRQHGRIRLWQYLRDRSLQKMDRIVVPSRFLGKVVAGWGFHDKAEVIYNGIPSDYGAEFVDVTPEQARRELGLSGDVVLSAGRLTSWKGFEAIIRALRHLGPGTNLLVAGDGPHKAELVRVTTEHELTDSVRFVGRIDHSELPLYFRAADCFVLNSGYEGFPHVLLEAMKLQCPVIAADCCGTPELIADGVNGILVKKDDEEGIAGAVRSFRSNPDLRITIVAEGAKTSSKFSWDHTLNRTLQLLESMV